MPKQTKPSAVQLAANLYGCPVEELLSYREYEDGSVVIIAPTGQKIAYSAQSIIEHALKISEGPLTVTRAPMLAAARQSCEEQLLSGSFVSEVPQVTHTDPSPPAALEEIHGQSLAEAQKIEINSEQTAEQLGRFHADLDSPAAASKKKRKAAGYAKADDAK